ncbi:unnamed protein product [Periconia digitata]|uniref:F-box domain-containing protein n=1 Tax=Periconia digitata TaxID=1303443 RepID=A0A9W4UBU8_9PLEO|nr:unnamed protein product [Periconia digitata]
MDSIPPEILSEIIIFLDKDTKISAYSTISRTWQHAIEQRTFRSLKLTADDVGAFKDCFVSDNIRRAQYMTKLDIDLAYCRSSVPDVAIAFLNALSDIANRAPNVLPLTLSLSLPHSQGESDIWDIQLPDNALDIHQVEAFVLQVSGLGYYMRQAAAFNFLLHFPRIRSAKLSIMDMPEWGLRRRRSERQELGNAIQATDFSHLTEFVLTVWHISLRDENWPPGSLVPGGNLEDPYRTTMRRLSTAPNLKTLHLMGPLVICPDFFSELPTFPALEDFQLDFATETADDRWFFIRDEELEKRMEEEDEDDDSDDEESDSDSDSDSDNPWVKLTDPDDEEGPLEHRDEGCPPRFRTLPNPDTIRTLLLGAARFVQDNPKLQRFILRNKTAPGLREQSTAMMYDYMTRNLQLWYMKPGIPRSDGIVVRIQGEHKYLSHPRLYWRVGDWRPDEDVTKAWSEVTGPDTKVFFLKDDNFDPWSQWPIYLGDLEDELVE